MMMMMMNILFRKRLLIWFLVVVVVGVIVPLICSTLPAVSEHATEQSKAEKEEEEQKQTVMICPDGSSQVGDEKGSSCVNTNDNIDPSSFKQWVVDNVGDKTKQFLQDNVFGKVEAKLNSNGFKAFFVSEEETGDDGNKKPFYTKLFDQLSGDLDKMVISDDDDDDDDPNKDSDVVYNFLEHARLLGHQDDNEEQHGTKDVVKLLGEAFLAVKDQLKELFSDILDDLHAFLTVSVMYYMGEEDKQKSPTWKRQQHRFYESITKKDVLMLHDALYMSRLAYANTLTDFRDGLKKFQNDTWELVYGTTESLPHLPAHFLIIHKQLTPLAEPALQSILPWERQKMNEIQVGLVVRGTKNLADALADGLLRPTKYRGGYAHEGIMTTGLALVNKHLPKLRELLKYSQRDRIRLYVVGHSLGAGAGAIAAMEFNDYDFIDAKAIGFGCPSALSRELSESTKDYVRTVVADADIIPRMSGASIVNVILDMLEYDWGTSLLEDVALSMNRAKKVLPARLSKLLPSPESAMKKLDNFFETKVRPKLMGNNGTRPRLESILVPPGTCVHLYRDGVGYTGSVTPCDFFSSIDISRTLVDDHNIMPGYHRALITMMRDWENDHKFDFPHDISSIKTRPK